MELKTIKDIGRDMRLTSAIPGFARDELREEIKQEAIKWYHRSDGNKHKFIMEFFNLTKDDVISEKHDE